MIYQASCHCGRVRFSFESEPIVWGARCDCSLFMRRGAVFSEKYIPEKDFTPHANPDAVGVYLWNEHVLNNYFCRACGIFTYIGDGDGNKDGYRVNLGCVVASRMESAGEPGRLNVSAYTYDLIRHQFAGEYRG